MSNTETNKQTYIINVTCNEITGKSHIYNKFNYEISDEMYKTFDENGYPLAYNLVYKLALTIPKNKVIVTVSPDPAMSAATIAGLAEKHMYGQVNNSQDVPNLKIIYITSSPHLLTKYTDITVENLRNSIVSNLMGMRTPSFTSHKLALKPDQFFLIGINDNLLDDDQKEMLDETSITYFTLDQIRQKGVASIIDYINEKIAADPVMVVYDMSSVEYETAPCVTRFLKDGIKANVQKLTGFNKNELTTIFARLNTENLVGLDITSFDFRIDSKERAYRVSCEAARLPLGFLLGKTEKKINIFNEHSRFLIYRPIVQLSETDVGWYILRGVPLNVREEVMASIDDDTITSLTVDVDGNDETVLITTTTMAEQETKSYFSQQTKIIDCTLFPVEKTSMMFELLNTNENSIHM